MSQNAGPGTSTPPDKQKPEKVDPIMYRWIESGAEWAQTQAGHYRVLRCGDLMTGARVRLKIPGLQHRVGTVQGLIPGIGPSPRPVIAVVALDPPALLPAAVSAMKEKLQPIIRHYRAEMLEVIP